MIGKQINLGSPKQLQVVLFDELEMPKTKRTKTGYTTDADALQSLYDKTGHPFLQHLLAHRDATRLKVTVDGLLNSVASDGRIHTTFNQTIAATGRLSSTEPNLQNIPIRTDAGRRIRDAFVVGTGSRGDFAELMTADYSQIEMRIMAHLSKDDGLIEAFRTGEDLHSFVASRAFTVPIDEVTPELRRRVKAMSYGLAYGLSAYGLAAQLRISTEEAKVQMEQYFARFGGVRDYLHEVVDQARKDGYTSTVLGRRRYLPELDSSNRQVREAAERAALNAPIQGSAADIIKVAMINVDRAIKEAGLASRMLLQVHDELLFEVAAGERDAVENLVREQMGNAYPLDVPLEVSVGSAGAGTRRRTKRGVASGGWCRAEHPLQVGFHRLQLLAPVLPAVGAAVGEVEHRVLAAGGEVRVLEGLVGAKGEALEELRVKVVAAEFVGLAVAAVHPQPGVVGDELADVDHRVVALPRRVTGRAPHVLGLVAARVVHRRADECRPPALGQVQKPRQGGGVDVLLRVVHRQHHRCGAGHREPHRGVAVRLDVAVGL